MTTLSRLLSTIDQTPRRRLLAGLAIFSLALVVRVAWVSRLSNELPWEDERQYAEIARHLVAGEGFVSDSYRATPVLPWILSLVFRALGENYFVARLLQCVVAALTCVLIYRLASRLIGSAAGVISGVWLALYPPQLYLAGVFYAELFATFLLVLSVFLTVRAVAGRGSVLFALGAGVTLGVSVLCRPVLLASVMALLFAILLAFRLPAGRRLLLCLALLVACAATVLPWAARNARVFGRFVPVSSGMFTKLWQGNNELSDGGPDDRELMWNTPEWHERLDRLDDATRRTLEAKYAALEATYQQRFAERRDRYLVLDEILKPVILRELRSRPLRFLRLMALKVTTLYSAFSSTITSNQYVSGGMKWVAALSFYPVLALALIGTWLGLSDRTALIPLYLVIVFMTLAYATLTACTRFRLPIDPFFIILASPVIARLLVKPGSGVPDDPPGGTRR